MKWEGLWYQEEGSNLYKSNRVSIEGCELKKRIVLKHNPRYVKGKNTPRYLFRIIDPEIEEETVELDVITRSRAIELLEYALESLEYGNSAEDVLANYSHDMRQSSFTVNT